MRALLAKRASEPESYPLSFAQERLWFLNELVPDDTSYIIPAAFEIRGSPKLTTLRQAVQEVVRRHEALRTTFIARQGTLVSESPRALPFHFW